METTEAPLQNTWTAWEHRKGGHSGTDYGSNMNKMCTFNTVEGLWRFINYTPLPSEVFTTADSNAANKFPRRLEAISVFKNNIKPEWEDPKNMSGGEFTLRKGLNPMQLDQIWEDLLLAAVGETLDPTDVITGVRVVDKSAKGTQMYRFEVWFECSQDKDPQLVEAIRENIVQAINFSNVKLDYKSHMSVLNGDSHGGYQPHGGGGRGYHGRRG